MQKWVAQLRCGGDRQREQAARGLCSLASNSDNNKVAIAKAGGIAPLVALARGGTDGQKSMPRPRRRCDAPLLAVNADNSIDAAECKHRPGGAPRVGEQPPTHPTPCVTLV